MSWRCPDCDADLTAIVKQGVKTGIRCHNCHHMVDAKRRSYRTAEIQVDGDSYTVKIYRVKNQVGSGYGLEGTTECMGQMILQSTRDEDEKHLLSLIENAIRMRKKKC